MNCRQIFLLFPLVAMSIGLQAAVELPAPQLRELSPARIERYQKSLAEALPRRAWIRKGLIGVGTMVGLYHGYNILCLFGGLVKPWMPQSVIDFCGLEDKGNGSTGLVNLGPAKPSLSLSEWATSSDTWKGFGWLIGYIALNQLAARAIGSTINAYWNDESLCWFVNTHSPLIMVMNLTARATKAMSMSAISGAPAEQLERERAQLTRIIQYFINTNEQILGFMKYRARKLLAKKKIEATALIARMIAEVNSFTHTAQKLIAEKSYSYLEIQFNHTRDSLNVILELFAIAEGKGVEWQQYLMELGHFQGLVLDHLVRGA